MKSEKAKRYLLKVVAPIAMMYPEYPEECDLKLGEAKRAVELAEQEAEARMRKELTRWNDPNKPPTDEMRVIAKVVLPNGATLVTGAAVLRARHVRRLFAHHAHSGRDRQPARDVDRLPARRLLREIRREPLRGRGHPDPAAGRGAGARRFDPQRTYSFPLL